MARRGNHQQLTPLRPNELVEEKSNELMRSVGEQYGGKKCIGVVHCFMLEDGTVVAIHDIERKYLVRRNLRAMATFMTNWFMGRVVECDE